MDDSDEDLPLNPKTLFPWHQPLFENVYDQNEALVKLSDKHGRPRKPGYPQAPVTDKHINLKHIQED